MLAKISVDQALLKAKSHIKKNQIQEAKKLYQDVLLVFPQNIRAQFGLNSIKKNKHHNLTKNQLDEKIKELINFFNQGKFEEVLGEAKSITEKYSETYKAWNILGATYYQMGLLEEAKDAYKKCISIKPDYAEAYSNLGKILSVQGKLDEALHACNKAILLKPKLVEASINLGDLLIKHGKFERAILIYKKALLQNPNHPTALNNFANILKNQGKLEEAIEYYKKSISIKPDYIEAYNNLGNALSDQGNLEQAIRAYEQSIILNPHYPEVYNNIGVTYKKQGKLWKAIECFNKSISLNPNYKEALSNFAEAIMFITFNQFNSSLQNTIILLLEQKTLVRPRNIARAVISLLKQEPTLKWYLYKNSLDELNLPLQKIIEDLSKLTLLLKLMSLCPINDVEIENLLKKIRSRILLSGSTLKNTPEIFNFQSALAQQCFCNEYIYSVSKEEKKSLQILEKQVKLSLDNNVQDTKSLLCIASYKSLNKYKWCDDISRNIEIVNVFNRQVIEPNLENRLKSDLHRLKKVNNKISLRVKKQYETNPYPKWVNLALSLSPFEINKWIKILNLKLYDNKIKEISMPQILIAGCGTGQHSIETAARFKNCNVTAIDLSLSSLAYAKRKTRELSIQNIDYMHADILDLINLKKEFDIIESVGVLHHMDDPFAGWEILTKLLKPGGLMRIGLYSELARKNIVKIRNEISKLRFKPKEADIKNFRLKVIRSEQKHHKEMLNFNDFYNISELKDLLFHVQEHRFSLPEIQEYLNKLNLKFCGFDTQNIISSFKTIHPKIDDCYSLEKWHNYEKSHPRVFSGMYQFWCQKLL